MKTLKNLWLGRGAAVALCLLLPSSDFFALDSFEAPDSEELCRSVPPNDLRIPVKPEFFRKDSAGPEGITEEQFESVIAQLKAAYPDIEFRTSWAKEEVNAYASRGPNGSRIVTLFGGLTRHPAITEEGFLLVGCHEVGHHHGGAPRRTTPPSQQWASVEGQADHFSTLRCLRTIWKSSDNAAAIGGRPVDPTVEAECSRQFSEALDRDICRRASFAALSLTRFFAALDNVPEPTFQTPDTRVVNVTYERHPAPQCRLDTFFQGSLFAISSETEPNRPGCWFRKI